MLNLKYNRFVRLYRFHLMNMNDVNERNGYIYVLYVGAE